MVRFYPALSHLAAVIWAELISSPIKRMTPLADDLLDALLDALLDTLPNTLLAVLSARFRVTFLSKRVPSAWVTFFPA